jgi:hypothetical protein
MRPGASRTPTKPVDPAADEQSRIARHRNRRIIRIGRIANGYLVTEGVNPDPVAYHSRQEVHAHLDRFLDSIELAEMQDDED